MLRPLLLLFLVLAAPLATASDDSAPPPPRAVIAALHMQLVTIANRSRNLMEMAVAQERAASLIDAWIASHADHSSLLAGPEGPALLGLAADNGFPLLVRSLLRSDMVRRSVNAESDSGLTPWALATLAMRQSIWVCRPELTQQPTVMVPLLMTLPFYTASKPNVYVQIRELLEKAGAVRMPAKAKSVWLRNCAGASPEAIKTVTAAADPLPVLLQLGEAQAAALAAAARR